jgi:hypothetical protein
MTRAVYLGGFGMGRSSAKRVGSVLENHFEEIDVFTFSDYVRKQDEVQKAMRGVSFVAHSAGALAIADYGSVPSEALLLNPPLRRSIPSLLARTAHKQVRMNTPGIGIYAASDATAAARFTASAAAELLAHPIANLGSLKAISGFDAVEAAAEAKIADIDSRIIWTDQDSYFSPTALDLERARAQGVKVEVIGGEHDEIVLRPELFVSRVFGDAETQPLPVQPELPAVQYG